MGWTQGNGGLVGLQPQWHSRVQQHGREVAYVARSKGEGKGRTRKIMITIKFKKLAVWWGAASGGGADPQAGWKGGVVICNAR